MKKQLLFIALMVITISQIYAQGQTRIGAHAGFGTADLGLGFGAQGEFSLSDKLSIAPAFTYWTGKSSDVGGFKVEVGGWNLDGDLRYYFTTEGTSIYGLAGLSYASVKATVGVPGTSASASASTIGLNVGAGMNFNTGGKVIPNLEVKYNTPFAAIFILAGIGFPIGGK